MEKEIKIPIPEGYDDVEWNEETHSLKFIKKNTLPKTWDEYCAALKDKEKVFYYINDQSFIVKYLLANDEILDHYSDQNLITSKEEADAFRTLMQLRQLRHAWIGNYDPTETNHYCIEYFDSKFTVRQSWAFYSILTFPTQEMAEEFLNCFADLIERIKPLYK